MESNADIIKRFYGAFQTLDYKTMQSCYSDDAVFSDPVFGLLDVQQTRYMWEMLCKRARNFSLVFSEPVLLDEEYATCEWVAKYTFSATGRTVVNRIKAHMRCKDGKITEHSDAFAFYSWVRQALGIRGLLLGWSGFVHKRIQNRALVGLEQYIKQQKQ